MFKTNSRFKRSISMLLVFLMLLTLVQIPAFAETLPIYAEMVEVSEDILLSDAFYLATSNVQLPENAGTSYLIKVARGNAGYDEASVRLNIMDITAKYGTDYKIKIYNSSLFDEKVQNTDDSKSLLEEILENEDILEEVNYSDGIVSDEEINVEEANELYAEDVELFNAYMQDLADNGDLTDLSDIAEPIDEDVVSHTNEPLPSYNEDIIEADEEEFDASEVEVNLEADTETDFIDIIKPELLEEDILYEDFPEEFLPENLIEEDDSDLYAKQTPTTPIEMKSYATGIESDRQPMDGDGNTLSDFTEETLAALSLDLDSAYLIIDFAEGETEKYIEIIPINNNEGDGDRMFTANLFANSENAQISSMSGLTVNILDDEIQEPATVTFTDSEYYPEDGFIKVTLERKGAINQLVSVGILTEDDTAVKERDYSQVQTTVSFPYGITKRVINIPIRSDFVKEPVSFNIYMSDTTNCNMGEIASAIGIIYPDSESYEIDEADLLSNDGNEASLLADATASSIILDKKLNLPGIAYSSGYHDKGYSRADGDTWVLNSANNNWDSDTAWAWVHFNLGSHYDYSGLRINWSRSCSEPCYKQVTEVSSYNLTNGEWPVIWSKEANGWNKRDDDMFFPTNEARHIYVGIQKGSGFWGKSPKMTINSIQPIKRPFEISLKGADPLKYISPDGTERPSTEIGGALASASDTILHNASETGTGTVVKFTGDSFTVSTSSSYAYISGLKIVNKSNGKSRFIRENLAEGTTSVSVTLDNNLIKNNLDYVTFTKNGDKGIKGQFQVQAVLDYYDTNVTIHPDHRGQVTLAHEKTLEGKYHIKNVNSGLYLYASGTEGTAYSSTADIVQKELRDAPEFRWNIALTSGNWYSMTADSGTCLVLPRGARDNSIILQGAKSATDQSYRYVFDETGDGSYVIYTEASLFQKVLDVRGSGTAEGDSVIQYDRTDGDNQKWILEPVNEQHSDDVRTYKFHKGDTLTFVQDIYDSQKSSYTASRINFLTKDNSSANQVDNKRLYDDGTNQCTISNVYSDIQVYPDFTKRDNHTIVRVFTSDLAKFDTSKGIFTAPSSEYGQYTDFKVTDEQNFCEGIYYEYSAFAKDDGYVPVWQQINTNAKYSQNTFYFRTTDDVEENIIYLSCEEADPYKYVLTGEAYYSDVALNTGLEGKAWMPASGVYVLLGSTTYGISNEEGKFTTVGAYGKNGYSVIYKTLASGITEYKTAILSNAKTINFTENETTVTAYNTNIGTIMSSSIDKTVPFVASVVATNTNDVQNGFVYINDNITMFTIAINNNGAAYVDSDGVSRTESVKAVDLMVYDGQTNELKKVIDTAREATDINGTSIWNVSPTFERGKSDEYAASDKIYVRLTTDRYIGNGTTTDADGNVVESDALKETVYAPIYTGYTIVEENTQEPVVHDIDVDTNMDFINLPLIGNMNATFNVKSISFTVTELPNGGMRLSIGYIHKSDADKTRENTADDGNEYGVKDIKKAFSGIKDFGEKSNDKSSMGMKSWGLYPVFGVYLDFGIKNVYYTENVGKKMVFIGGGIFMGITGNFRLVQYFIVGWVPFYMGVEGELSLFCDVGLSVLNEDTATSDSILEESGSFGSSFIPQWVLQANGLVAAYVGVGLCGTLGVRGGIQFNAGYIYVPGIKDQYPTYSENGLILSAAIKVWIDVVLFSIPIPVVNLFEVRYGYYKDVLQGGADLFGTDVADTENQIILKPRNSKNSQWTGDNVQLMSTFEEAFSTTLVVDGYDRADPQLLDLGNGRTLLVFLADDADRPDEDRTTLMYSVCEDGTWSQPIEIQPDDETADFEPSITNAGDKVLIAWTSREQGTPYVDETEYLRSLEIYTTTLDKDTLTIGSIEKLSDDNFYDSAPVTLYDDISGDMMVYYLKSNVEDSFEEAVNPAVNESVIVYMLYDAENNQWARDYYYDNEVENQDAEDELIANWGGQRFLSSPLSNFGPDGQMDDPIIMDFDAISYNGIGLYTYTVDADYNLDTDSDRELFVQAYDFENHKTYVPVRITNDNVTDAIPQLIRNGEYTYLFWLQNNADLRYLDVTSLIKYGVQPDGTIVEDDDYEMNIGVVFFLNSEGTDVNPTFGSYKAFVDSEDNLFVTWLQPVKNEDGTSNQEIFASALIQDEDGMSWSDGTRLTHSGKFNDEIAMVTDNNGNLITVSNQYMMNLNDDAYEVTDVNLVATHFKTVGSLEITKVEYSDDTPKTGSDVEVNISIKNDGLKPATGYSLEVYEKLNGVVGQKVFEETSDKKITPSSSVITTFNWTMPADYADVEELSLYIKVVENGMPEISEYTSESIKIQPVYNIVNYEITEDNGGFYINYIVENTGNMNALDTTNANVVVEFNDIYHTGNVVDNYLTEHIGELTIDEQKAFTKLLSIPDEHFDYGFTNAFIEVQDSEGTTLSNSISFEVVLDYPYNIVINGDDTLTEITLKEGESIELSGTYSPDEFYSGGIVNFSVDDADVAAITDNTLTGIKSGTTTLNAIVVPYGGLKTIKVTVEGEPKPSRPTGGHSSNTNIPSSDNDTPGTEPTPGITPEQPAETTFTDVNKTDWFHDSVMYVVDKGLFKGTSETTFDPYISTTRGMIVTVIGRMEGTITEQPTETAYTDVDSNEYYAAYIKWATDNGIVDGYGEGLFGPEDLVTREQLAKIIANYYTYKTGIEGEGIELTYTDADAISDWATEFVQFMTELGLMQGNDDGSFGPQNSALRCEVASVIERLQKNLTNNQ